VYNWKLRPKALFVLCLCLACVSPILRAQNPPVADPSQTDALAVAAPQPPQSAYHGFINDLLSPKVALATVPGTIIDQVHPFPKEWGEGTRAVEKRAASLYAQFVIGDFLERSVCAIDHESTRYTRLGAGGFFPRMAHIIVDTVVARKPDGSRVPAYSMMVNDYGSWAIATLWCPRSLRTPSSILEWGTGNVGVRTGGNLIREFWPDVKSLFRKK
jgi:hypothetical protein